MGYSFDGPNRRINLTAGTIEFDVQDLWSRWLDWFLTSDNSKYLPAMRNVGGEPTSPTRSLGVAVFLINNWRIVPQDANHHLLINGDLYTDPVDPAGPLIPVAGRSIFVEYSTSSLTQVLTVTGEIPEIEYTLIADAVKASEMLPGVSLQKAQILLLAAQMGLTRGSTDGTADEWEEILEALATSWVTGKIRIRAKVDQFGNRKQIEIDLT